MNERDDLPADERSRTAMATAATSGKVVASGPAPVTERVTLDFATWRARLAAPGSRFGSAPPASPPIIRLDSLRRAAVSAEGERRMA